MLLYLLKDAYNLGYSITVWKGTNYESFFSEAQPNSIPGKMWRERILMSPSQSLAESIAEALLNIHKVMSYLTHRAQRWLGENKQFQRKVMYWTLLWGAKSFLNHETVGFQY